MDTSQVAAQLVDALSLDVTVLRSLLSRQRCSHARTKYFKRMSMALRAVDKSNITHLTQRLVELKQTVRSFAHDQQKKGWKKRSAPGSTKLWDASNSKNDSDGEHFAEIECAFAAFHIQTNQGFPEIISRIKHATKSVINEVARGYFLPFFAVAVGALARIRAVVMRIGNFVLLDLQSHFLMIESFAAGDSLKCFEFVTGNLLKSSLDAFTEPESSEVDAQQSDSVAIRCRSFRHLGLSSPRSNRVAEQNFPSHEYTGIDAGRKEQMGAYEDSKNDGDEFVRKGNAATMIQNRNMKLLEENSTPNRVGRGDATASPEAEWILCAEKNQHQPLKTTKKRKAERVEPNSTNKIWKCSKKGGKKKKSKSKNGGDFFDTLFD